LDDLGTESNNDDSRERITQLLENRMSQMKPTIITTNLNEGDFKKCYGERFVSRTYEHFSKVYFTGNDKRK
jgi:DNA replication protein DnaC